MVRIRRARLTAGALLAVMLVPAASISGQVAATGTTARHSVQAEIAGRGSPEGGSLIVVRQEVEGGASVRVPAAPDSGLAHTRATAACGTARLCVAGWDLRVLSVALPDTMLETGARVGVATVIENRGRAASPASELQLCWGDGESCVDRIQTLDVPALASGERVRIAQPVTLANLPRTAGDRWTVIAAVDPDNATGEANRANNAGRTRPFGIDRPALQFLALDLPPQTREGAKEMRVTVRIRNKAFIATSPATEVQFGGGARACGSNWGDGGTRLTVPALAPRQVWNATVIVHHANIGWPCGKVLTATVDPDARQRWASSHEKAIEREYELASPQSR